MLIDKAINEFLDGGRWDLELLQEDNPIILTMDDDSDEEEGNDDISHVDRFEKLARYKNKTFYHPRSTNEHYGLSNKLDSSIQDALEMLLEKLDLDELTILGMVKYKGNIFRANALRDRHDWCLVDWSDEYGLVPAQIQLFVDLQEISLDEPLKLMNDCWLEKAGIYALGFSLPDNLEKAAIQATQESRLIKKASLERNSEDSSLLAYIWSVN